MVKIYLTKLVFRRVFLKTSLGAKELTSSIDSISLWSIFSGRITNGSTSNLRIFWIICGNVTNKTFLVRSTTRCLDLE
jgi:hypothetical protein